MKKTVFLLYLCFIMWCLCGCASSRQGENLKIVTACAATSTDNATEYMFFVSEPGSPSEEKDANSSADALIYKVSANSFSDAIIDFENACGKSDLSHLSIFFADMGYMTQKYSDDISHIQNRLSISPLIKFFVNISPSGDIFDAIIKNYDSNPKKYIDTAFLSDRKKLLCTMSEIFFACNNPLYTASVPTVEINKNTGYPVTNAYVTYNAVDGCAILSDTDFTVFSEAIKKFGKSSKLLKLSLQNGNLRVKFNSNGVQLSELAEKYKALGIDIMNAKYYSRKCFATYEKYLAFIQNKSVADISFVGE